MLCMIFDVATVTCFVFEVLLDDATTNTFMQLFSQAMAKG